MLALAIILGMTDVRWRPIRIGVFYYATRGSTTTTRNWVLRADCAAYCAARNSTDN